MRRDDCGELCRLACAGAADGQRAAKAAKPINAGDVLSGELTAMRVRGGAKGKRVATYQITSEPRRLPPPNGLCNLETGPETFQLITTSDSQAAELKRLVGKEISVKVDEISCAQDAGQMTEAVVTKWSVVGAAHDPKCGAVFPATTRRCGDSAKTKPYRPQRVEMSALLQPCQQDETRDRDQHADHEEQRPADGFRDIARA